jgi:glycosyltransferase involved in cell wall biosynthesis
LSVRNDGLLLDGLSQSQRSKICCIIDTHDLLFQRKEQFQHRGHSHWIDISKEEEASVLANFDVVVAIQFAEAETMRAMAPDANVIVVGHDAGECHVVERKNNADVDGGEAKFSLGYIGSVNASNVDAIESFLEQTWPRIAENESIELVIAGAICHKIADRVDQLNQQCAGQVRMLGRVENVVDFYQAVDVAINPVQFGTGLKVKTVEAVSHGIPVLTLEPVWAKSGKPSPAVVYLEDLVQLADQIESLLDDGGQAFERLKDRAVQTAKENNARSEKAVYQKLLDQIALSGANNLK